jgi:hypothetical protein
MVFFPFDFLLGLSFMFWATLIPILFVLCWIDDSEHMWPATVPTILAITVIYCIFNKVNPFPWIFYHIPHILAGVAAYLVAGALWSRFMWSTLVKRMAQEAIDLLKSRASSPDYIMRRSFEEEIQRIKTTARPKIGNYQYRLIGWIVNWPFSVLNYVMSDMIEKIAKWIIEKMTVIYNAVLVKSFDNKIDALDKTELEKLYNESLLKQTPSANNVAQVNYGAGWVDMKSPKNIT